MRFFFLLIGLLAGFNSFADNEKDIYRLFPVLECPAVGDEYEKMIANLDSIKASIKEGANCQNVTLKVKSLEDLVSADREKVLAIIANPDQALSAEQAQVVREYAENVTKKISSLMDLFMNSNYCFRDDQSGKQLGQLVGFMNEASRMVSSLTGPWGTPIALAGNVVAGFLTGMDQVLQSRAGYDFSKRQQWMNFVENLCTYDSYRDQVEHLLNPQARLAQLKALKRNLETHLALLGKQCPECRAIEAAYSTQRKLSAETISQQLEPQVQAANQHFSKPLGSYTLQNLGIRDWVLGEIKRIERESNSYWGDVSGRHMLSQAREQIEEFLIKKSAPGFIKYQIDESYNEYRDFLAFVSRDGRRLYARIQQSHPELIALPVSGIVWAYSLDVFRSLVIQPPSWNRMPSSAQNDDLKFAWNQFREQSLRQLRDARTSLQVVQSFCVYFKHSNQFTSDIREQCGSSIFQHLLKEESALEKELAAKDNDSPPPVLNPELMEKDPELSLYSRNKLESLSRAVERRSQQP